MVGKLMLIFREYAVKQYFGIRKAVKSRRNRKIIILLLTPVLLLICGWNYLYENTIKKIILSRIYKRDFDKEYEYELVFAAIVKNEGLYIKEWIEYHKLVGVDRFVIYDNESTDDTIVILKPYIESGLVEYVYMPGKAKQLDAYYDVFSRYRYKTRFIGCIDLDEFVVPVAEKSTVSETVTEILKENKYAVGVAMNWSMYGSSGHQNRPKGLVIENYLRRAEHGCDLNKCIKTIANPRMTKGYIFDPHAPSYYPGYFAVAENGHVVEGPWNPAPNNSYERIRVHHYFCKSYEECKIKFSRGFATHETDEKHTMDKFYESDKNEVYDDIMLRYVEQIKNNM